MIKKIGVLWILITIQWHWIGVSFTINQKQMYCAFVHRANQMHVKKNIRRALSMKTRFYTKLEDKKK